MSLSKVMKEIKWMRNFINELGYSQENATVVFQDSSSSVSWAKGNHSFRKVKHVKIGYHFIKEMIANKKIELVQVSTHDMTADILTKGLTQAKLQKALEYLSLKNSSYRIHATNQRFKNQCKQ